MAERQQVLDMLDGVLEPWRFKDYTINGLQVEGAGCIARVMGGVTASEALIDEAIAWQADTLLVHHSGWQSRCPVSRRYVKKWQY